MSPYPSLEKGQVDQLFLTYTGYSIGSDGTPHYQFWEMTDFLPLLTHTDSKTGCVDGTMFSDFLFLALGILNESGEGRHLTRNEKTPANWNEWVRYLDELFLCNRNLDALCQAVQRSCLSTTNVWIALPYPNPQIFSNDLLRVQAVVDWMCLFLATWTDSHLKCCLRLQGFYWLQESLYEHGGKYDDRFVIAEVNQQIHTCKMDGTPLKSIWIPYQQARGWSEWRSLGFDLAFLQPNAYFNPQRSISEAAASAYEYGMGVEMEFDLAVTYDQAKRERLLAYLRKGTTGGTDAQGRYFGPYQFESPLAWYTGGWFFGKNGRKQAMVSLYHSNDPLYDIIFRYLNGINEL
ncbi:DUF4855 domain-containing protein [Brevibacillus choshinensis]|uniref:DUF4855 domain-containing protein n=1 Tax=Brevibacillus choshinensis TaxID=54911 RepID=UPI002E1E0A0D|nr:DUF4855 domain-containing protein [Brevibacillus choshinensis]